MTCCCCHLSPCRKGNPSEVLVVRAAIFYISMALWGPNRISKLGSCFSPFLPTLMEVQCVEHWPHMK